MKRVVWVSGDLAWPPRAGGELRAARLVAELAKHAEVHLALLNPSVYGDQLAQQLGAKTTRTLARWQPAAAKRLTALRRRWPLPAAAMYDHAMASWVRETAGPHGIVVAGHLTCAPYLSGAHRSVLHVHDDDVAVLRETPAGKGIRGLERQWDIRTTARLQQQIVSSADLVVCVSELDRLAIDSRAAVVPNGTDLPTIVPPLGDGLLFVGSMDYAPNVDAVQWWVDEIAPLLPPDLPPLTVVGRGARPVAGLTVHGDVADVAPHLKDARVVVLPLRWGGGSRLKLLEAMAWGRPVVSTRKGAEGFPIGDELLLADDPRAFADAVVRAYREDQAAMTVRGRQFAEGYGWPRLAAEFSDLVLGAESS